MNFDINTNALAELETFTIEDVVLVAQLIQSNKYEDLAEQYEDIKVCANYLSNDPGLKFSNLTGKFFLTDLIDSLQLKTVNVKPNF